MERPFPSRSGEARAVINVPALVCRGCGEGGNWARSLARADKPRSWTPARARILSWTRRGARGPLATDLAALLGITAETVSRCGE